MNDIPTESNTSEKATPTQITTTTTTTTTGTPSDEESTISTSIASDTFETWTLLTDKDDKPRSTSSVEILNNETDDEAATRRPTESYAAEPSQAEGVKTNVDLQEINGCKTVEPDLQVDDQSDGISIISESENADRSTPHSFQQDPFNTDYDDGAEASLMPNEMEQLQRQRRRRRHSSRKELEQPHMATILKRSFLPQFVQRGLTGMFYVAVAVALLAFIGRLRYSEWHSFGDSGKPIAEIEEKISELELQNNLMRAEIDIMSKQVNYLSTFADGSKRKPGQEPAAFGRFAHERTGQQQQEQQMPERKAKAFKAWPGNGNKLEPVEITKSDLKRAYKCDDGQFVEFAGMCIEKRAGNEIPFIDELGDAVNDVLEQSQTYRQIKQVTETLSKLSEEPMDEQEMPMAPPTAAGEQTTAKSPEHDDFKHFAHHQEQQQQQRQQQKHHEQKNWMPQQQQHQQRQQYGNKNKHSHEHYDSNDKDSHERFKSKKHYDDNDDASKERHKRKYDDNSKEKRFGGGKYGDSSKERYKRHDHNSKERFSSSSNNNNNNHNKYKNDMKHKPRQSTTSGEQDDSKTGEWHAQLMHQREQFRRQHERQRNDKNWYIERGDSREQMRYATEERLQ